MPTTLEPAVKIERHDWGYFLEDDNKAVALVSLRWADVQRVLRTWNDANNT